MSIKSIFKLIYPLWEKLLTLIIISTVLLHPFQIHGATNNPSWYEETWKFRKLITVDNSYYNSGLSDYQIKIVLNTNNFDFTKAQPNGADLRFTQSDGRTSLNYWVETYNSSAQEANIWVKIPLITASSSTKIYMYYGNSTASNSSSGDGVFNFFTDVRDENNWTDGATATVSSTSTTAATISNIQTIVDDGNYNSVPDIVQDNNGDYLLTYFKGTTHTNLSHIMLRRSTDQGLTWSSGTEIYDRTLPDPYFLKAPNGDILVCFGKTQSSTSYSGASCMRSNDNGQTWANPYFLSNPVYKFFATDHFITVGSTIYAIPYGSEVNSTDPSSNSLWKSTDNGATWTEIVQVTNPSTETSVNESAIAYLGGQNLLVIARDGNNEKTWKKTSNDMGQTWSSLVDITSQVGQIEYPNLYWMGSTLVMLGREALRTNVNDVNTATKQTVAFFSTDNGTTFGNPIVIENYNNGFPNAGGYAHALIKSPTEALVVYYTATTSANKPAIHSANLTLSTQTQTTSDLHIREYFGNNPATHTISKSLSKYIMEFRLKSEESVGGNQLYIGFNDTDVSNSLVKWQIPSSNNTTDKNKNVEIFEGSTNYSIYSSWSTGNYYRYKTIIDENTQRQSNYLYDDDGNLLGSRENKIFALGSPSSLNKVHIGAGTTKRTTDSFLSWLYIRQYSSVEPLISISSSEEECQGCSTAASNTNSNNGEPDPNIRSGWKYRITAGPHYIGINNFIRGTLESSKAMTFISNTAHHDDMFVNINQHSPNFLTKQLIPIPFPWQQGLNVAGEIYDFKAVSAFNGYSINEFDNPVTVVIPYDPSKLYGISPHLLRIAWWDSDSGLWTVIKDNTVVDTTNLTVANTTKRFSYFTVVYPANIFKTDVPLPERKITKKERH